MIIFAALYTLVLVFMTLIECEGHNSIGQMELKVVS